MNDQEIDRMLDMHAEAISRQIDTRRNPSLLEAMEQAIERWSRPPRLVVGRVLVGDRLAAWKRTQKRKRQRARAKARKASGQ